MLGLVLVLVVLILAVICFVLFAPLSLRDRIAERFSSSSFKVAHIVDVDPTAEGAVRDLWAYYVTMTGQLDGSGGQEVVLAKSQRRAEQYFNKQTGSVTLVNCINQLHRVVPSGPGQWSLIVLPTWMSFMGTTECEHDGIH